MQICEYVYMLIWWYDDILIWRYADMWIGWCRRAYLGVTILSRYPPGQPSPSLYIEPLPSRSQTTKVEKRCWQYNQDSVIVSVSRTTSRESLWSMWPQTSPNGGRMPSGFTASEWLWRRVSLSGLQTSIVTASRMWRSDSPRVTGGSWGWIGVRLIGRSGLTYQRDGTTNSCPVGQFQYRDVPELSR